MPLQHLKIGNLFLCLFDSGLHPLLLTLLLSHKRRRHAAWVILGRQKKFLQLLHEWTSRILHEACHVDLHALWTEGHVNVRDTLFELRVSVNHHDLVFDAHELWDSLFHPLLYHVYFDLHQVTIKIIAWKDQPP